MAVDRWWSFRPEFKAKLTQAVDFGTLVPATLYQRGLIGASQLSSLLAAGSGHWPMTEGPICKAPPGASAGIWA
ncbi:MAG: hypothetical protein WDN69_18395 [Aliidongia sp.]